MSWSQLVLGWPAILLALAAFGVAFARGRSPLGFAGLIFATPFLWYASGAPGGMWMSPVLFAGLTAAAVLLRRGRRALAAACFAPFAAIVLILAIAVATQRSAAP